MSKKPLIEKIEINYFRSIHSGTMKACKPLNIIVGGNDSGKSNILRALNLFFHNETDLGHEYDFDQDLSLKRVLETQKGKTRTFLYVKITFNNIFGYGSLPEVFTVKKQWNRYSKSPELQVFPRTIKLNTLYRFLNKIELHYVPAVKSREIFKYYLQLLYDTLVQKDIKLSEASGEITEVINNATEYMSERIKEGIVNDKTEIFKFTKQDGNPFSAGIENILSPEIAQEIHDDDKFWSKTEKDDGHKKMVIKELDKVKACKHVCKKNDKEHFALFESLVNHIEEFVENDD